MNSALLRKQALTIMGTGAYPRFRFRAIFVFPNKQLEVIRVIEKWSSSDFITSFTSDVELKIATTTKDYQLMYQYRDNLNVVLIQEQVDPVSDTTVVTGIRSSVKYRALLKDNEIGSLISDSPLTNAPFTDGSDDLKMYTVQLVDPIAFGLNTKFAQGIFRFTGPATILKAVILSQAEEDKKLGLPELLGLDVETPDNDEALDNVVIDNDVKMVRVAKYIQNEIRGIYNTGIGSFIKDQHWYIYPAFNTRRFTTTTKRLTVIQSSSLSLPTADMTFQKSGDSITVVCTGGVKTQDLSVSGGANGGMSVHFTRATGLLDNPAINSTDNSSVYNREAISADITTAARSDGNTLANVSGITDNLAKELSKIASQSGMLMVTTWQRSDVRILTPGMPVRVYYDVGGKVTTLEGVLIQADEQWTGEQPGLLQKTFKSAATLFMYLEKV